MVVDGWDVFGFDDIQGLDGQAREWSEDADGVEKEADYVFLGEPAEFGAVVESRIERGFAGELFPRANAAMNRYYNVLCTFQHQINGLQETDIINQSQIGTKKQRNYKLKK